MTLGPVTVHGPDLANGRKSSVSSENVKYKLHFSPRHYCLPFVGSLGTNHHWSADKEPRLLVSGLTMLQQRVQPGRRHAQEEINADSR